MILPVFPSYSKNNILQQFINSFNLMKKSKKILKKQQKPIEPSHRKRILKTLELSFDDFTQVYEDVDISECISETKDLLVKKLIKLLERNYNLSFLNKQVKYYLQDGNIWLLCPKFKMTICEQDYQPFEMIRLSVLIGKEYIEAIMEQSDSDSESEANSEEDWDNDLKCRRLKERKIKHVIEKVLKWRQLYAGIGLKDKVPLQEGAKTVNISKKTLDDYLSQIKKGKKYGFNFNEHKNQKVGILRQFIRKSQKNKK